VLVAAGTLCGQAKAVPPPQAYQLAVDVPTRLGGMDYTTNQIVRRTPASAYALEAALPSDVAISAIERRAFDGAWLFTPSDPWTIGAMTFLPRDVVSWNGTTFGLALLGAATGIPADARIDAISETPAGKLELSFDDVVRLGAADYGRSDLVQYSDGVGFALAWSGSLEGVPEYANLTGASRDAAGTRMLAFDVPVNLGGIEFLPGDLVRWTSPATFSLASHDSGWPQDSVPRDFTSIPAVGTVGMLLLSKSTNQIILTWGSACGSSASTDYEVYEGTIGSWYSHTARYCSTNSALTSSFAPPAGNWYYLVAARNGPAEGSYGTDSSHVEIPQASNACVPQQLALCP
jgi:hypothetical protein